MKTERLILSFIAILVGLLVAGIGFYVYQIVNKKPSENTNRITLQTSPTPATQTVDKYPLTVDSPQDELVTDKKTVSISGKTGGNVIIIISNGIEDQVLKATSSGNFTATQTLASDVNAIRITALFQDGTEKQVSRTITYSTESF